MEPEADGEKSETDSKLEVIPGRYESSVLYSDRKSSSSPCSNAGKLLHPNLLQVDVPDGVKKRHQRSTIMPIKDTAYLTESFLYFPSLYNERTDEFEYLLRRQFVRLQIGIA